MNIESSKAALMPVAHHAPSAKNTHVQTQVGSPARAAPEQKAPINNSALQDLENRKRVAIVEKLMGMNKSLIVEKDTQRVGYIYKTVDKSTGEVTRVWPQQEVATALAALADSDARSIISGMMIDASI